MAEEQMGNVPRYLRKGGKIKSNKHINDLTWTKGLEGKEAEKRNGMSG